MHPSPLLASSLRVCTSTTRLGYPIHTTHREHRAAHLQLLPDLLQCLYDLEGVDHQRSTGEQLGVRASQLTYSSKQHVCRGSNKTGVQQQWQQERWCSRAMSAGAEALEPAVSQRQSSKDGRTVTCCCNWCPTLQAAHLCLLSSALLPLKC